MDLIYEGFEWVVGRIGENRPLPPSLCHALVVQCPKEQTRTVVRSLQRRGGRAREQESLKFLRRVRPASNADGKVDILWGCGEAEELEKLLKELAPTEAFSFEIRGVDVPAFPPREYIDHVDEWANVWPLHGPILGMCAAKIQEGHPLASLSIKSLFFAWHCMELAVKWKGAILADVDNLSVIAVGTDCRRFKRISTLEDLVMRYNGRDFSCNSVFSHFIGRSAEEIDDDDGTDGHPLAHPVLIAIRKNGYVLQKRKSMIEKKDIGEMGSLHLHCHECHDDGGAGGDAKEERHYCDGLDMFVFREPCSMCSMALVHSRIGRIFFHEENKVDGSIGSLRALHADKSLNHQFKVFVDRK
jgi:tRNA(Arg) A34 adenosine deaminase TadA